MTQEQKDFIDEVILPKLVKMAIDCTLPSDMTQLSSYDFEEEAEKFNSMNDNQECGVCGGDATICDGC